MSLRGQFKIKLPDFTLHAGLNGLKQRMGIAANTFGSFSFVLDAAKASPELVEQLESDAGYEAGLSEIQVLEDGTLGIKNRRVVLYIRDKSFYGRAEELPRFHTTNCSTLRKMWQDNKSGRFVSYSKDDGIFLVNFIKGATRQTKRLTLPVCRNCLDQLAYKGYSNSVAEIQKKKAVLNFRLKDFFLEHPRSFHTDSPRFCFETAPLDIYPANFPEISRQIRQSRGWKCEIPNCPADFSQSQRAHLRRYLHVHHRNGLKYDNSPDNLQCLCLKCHAEQPQHSHMRSIAEYPEFRKIWHSLGK
jgi:hypothetical protein